MVIYNGLGKKTNRRYTLHYTKIDSNEVCCYLDKLFSGNGCVG